MKNNLIFYSNHIAKAIKSICIVLVMCAVSAIHAKNVNQVAGAPVRTPQQKVGQLGQKGANKPAVNWSQDARDILDSVSQNQSFALTKEYRLALKGLTVKERELVEDEVAEMHRQAQKSAKKQKIVKSQEELLRELRESQETIKRLAMQLAKQQGFGSGLTGLAESIWSKIPGTEARYVQKAMDGLAKQMEEGKDSKYPNYQSVLDGIDMGEFTDNTRAGVDAFKKALIAFRTEIEEERDGLIGQQRTEEMNMTNQIKQIQQHFRYDENKLNDYVDALKKSPDLLEAKAIVSEYLRARTRLDQTLQKKASASQQQQQPTPQQQGQPQSPAAGAPGQPSVPRAKL